MSNKISIQGLFYYPNTIMFDMDYKYSRNFTQTCTPGIAVFDFMYLDKDKISTALTTIREAFSTGRIEDALLYIEAYSRHDAYFTAYINIYLGCLYVRTEEGLSEFTDFIGSGFVAPSVDSPDFDNELIKRIIANIEQKQNEIKSLVENFLEDLHNNYSESLYARFLKESATNRLVNVTLKCFPSTNTRALSYPIDSIDEMIRFELMQMLFLDVDFKICKCCGRYFVPSGRSDSQYCERIFGDTKKRCSQIGALRTFENSHKNDPIHKAYIKAYRRMDSRQRSKLITKEEFKEFGKIARTERKKCYDGEITLEQFQTWLDDYK